MSFSATPIGDAIEQFRIATNAPDPRQRRRENFQLTNGDTFAADTFQTWSDELLLELFRTVDKIARPWHVSKVASRANDAWCVKNAAPMGLDGKAGLPNKQIGLVPKSKTLAALRKHTSASGAALAREMQHRPHSVSIVGGDGCWALTNNDAYQASQQDDAICIAFDLSVDEPQMGVMVSGWFLQQLANLTDPHNPCSRVAASISVKATYSVRGQHALFVKIDSAEHAITLYDPNGPVPDDEDYPFAEAALAALSVIKNGIPAWDAYTIKLSTQMACQQASSGNLSGSCLLWSNIAFDVSILAPHAPDTVLGTLSAQMANADDKRGVSGNDILRAYASMRIDDVVAACIQQEHGAPLYSYDWRTGHLTIAQTHVATFFIDWSGILLERAPSLFQRIHISSLTPDTSRQKQEAMSIEDTEIIKPYRANIPNNALLKHSSAATSHHHAMIYCSWLVALVRLNAARDTTFPDVPYHSTAAEFVAEMASHHPATIMHDTTSMDTSTTSSRYSNYFNE